MKQVTELETAEEVVEAALAGKCGKILFHPGIWENQDIKWRWGVGIEVTSDDYQVGPDVSSADVLLRLADIAGVGIDFKYHTTPPQAPASPSSA